MKTEMVSVYDSDMSTRAKNVLARAGIITLQQAAALSDEELTAIKGMDAEIIKSIKHTLASVQTTTATSTITEITNRFTPVAETWSCFAERYPEPLCSALKEAGIYSKEDLSRMSTKQFAEFPGVTPEIMTDAECALRAAGLAFKNDA